MPMLPSGLAVALSPGAIPERMPADWFECPEGHFWFEAPDVSMSPPPYTREDGPPFLDFRHAPVPTDHASLAPYIRVTRRDPDGAWWWAGDTLADFPRYVTLDAADLAAWREWLASARTRQVLDEWLERCRRQAASNGGASGFAVFRSER
jgi:hypothetical protein